MNEEKNITMVKARVKKTETVKKTKIKKSSFGLNDNLNIVSAGSEAGFKIKTGAKAKSLGEPKNIYRKIALSFVVLTVILAASVLYFGFAKLTIVIIPAKEKITDSSILEVLSDEKNAGLAAFGQGQIYGLIRQVPVEQSREFSAGGKEILGEEVTGKVTIINDYIKNQPLVATTRLLSSDGKLFRLKNTVNVPAGGRVEAEVYADSAKPEMAIGSNKFTLPGLWAGLQDKIYAESKEPMKYSQKIKYVIKQSDIDQAVSQLKDDLLANAKNQVEAAYKNYAQILFAVDNNSVTQAVGGKVGEEKEKFSINMKIMVTVVAFNDDEVYDQAKARLAAILADDKELFKFDKSDMVYTLTSSDLLAGTAVVSVDSTAQAILKDSAKVIKKNNLAGLSYDQLRIYLNGLPEVFGYQINFFPSFVKKAPNLSDRIEIVIKK